MAIKLSEASYKDIMSLEKLASEGNLLEMRNKYGVLLSVGKSVKDFHSLKDKRGNMMYSVIKTEVLEYDKIVTKVHHDILLDVYSEKRIIVSNPKLQKAIENSEEYWKKKVATMK